MSAVIGLSANMIIKELYNGSVKTIQNIIKTEQHFAAPQLTTKSIEVKYGVLIGYNGNFKGDLVIQADPSVFREIGGLLYGMSLPDEMLDSFSGELGNMLAGGLSTHLANAGIETDITHPTIMNGVTQLSGFKRALEVMIQYEDIGNMKMSILLNDETGR
ncbi:MULTISPECIES: chemotaxis protein CheX [Gracilibacillus]|uniref:chemotaxis protein CheX n=1 Tax=Gracilibacillus TaxID=74385 RepID=UPI00082488CB|nr:MULTISPECIES: chemotaxis protein CheX [Gracilibacillus]